MLSTELLVSAELWGHPVRVTSRELFIALLATAGWLASIGVVALRTRAGRATAGRATHVLRDEAPAVVHLLTHGWSCAPEAAEATLMDLAARGYLTLERVGDAPEQCVVRVAHTVDEGLTPHEQHVMGHVRSAIVGGEVPLPGLARGDAAHATWRIREFQRLVRAEARAQGLTRTRLTRSERALALTSALTPALAWGAILGGASDLLVTTITTAIAFSLLVRALGRVKGERDTPSGLVAASHWLGVRDYLRAHEGFAELPPAAVTLWGRYLSYGAALDVATTTLHTLELGAGDHRLAWSAYGGGWRKVPIRYTRGLYWGKTLDTLFGFALSWMVWGAVMGWMLLEAQRGGWILALGWVAVVAGGAMGFSLLVRVIVDRFWPVILIGQVLHCWDQERRFASRRGRNVSPYRHWIALDEGQTVRARAYILPDELRHDANIGDVVMLKAGRFFGRARELDVRQEGWRWRLAQEKRRATK